MPSCPVAVVSWPDDEAIEYSCTLDEGHDPDVSEEIRVHVDQEMRVQWTGWDVDTVEGWYPEC